jgi:hypothetical protein
MPIGLAALFGIGREAHGAGHQRIGTVRGSIMVRLIAPSRAPLTPLFQNGEGRLPPFSFEVRYTPAAAILDWSSLLQVP